MPTLRPHRTLVGKLESAAQGSNVPHATLVQTLKELGEIMVYGDRQSETYFEYFCERGVMRLMNQVMKSTPSPQVRTQILQTLMILLQNIQNERSLFYLLSNNQVNDLLTTTAEGNFLDEEYLAYYVSLAKALSLTLNKDTVHFFLNRRSRDQHGAPKFPLYTETLRFYNHADAMVRTAVRTIILSVWRLDEPVVRAFVVTKPHVAIFQKLAEQAAAWLRKMSEASAVAAAASRGWELRVRQVRSAGQQVRPGSRYKFVPMRSASESVGALRHADDVMETEWGEALDVLMFFGDVFALHAEAVTQYLREALFGALLQPLLQSLCAAALLARHLPANMHMHVAPCIPEAQSVVLEQRPTAKAMFTPAACTSLLSIAMGTARGKPSAGLLETPIALMGVVALLRAMVDASIADELVRALLADPLPGLDELHIPLPTCQGVELACVKPAEDRKRRSISSSLDTPRAAAESRASRADDDAELLGGAASSSTGTPVTASSPPLPTLPPARSAGGHAGGHGRSVSGDVGSKASRVLRSRKRADIISIQRRAGCAALRTGRDLLLHLVQNGDARSAHAALGALWTLAHMPGEAMEDPATGQPTGDKLTPWNRPAVVNRTRLAAAGLHCISPSRAELLLSAMSARPSSSNIDGMSVVSHASASAEAARSSARRVTSVSTAMNPLAAELQDAAAGSGEPSLPASPTRALAGSPLRKVSDLDAPLQELPEEVATEREKPALRVAARSTASSQATHSVHSPGEHRQSESSASAEPTPAAIEPATTPCPASTQSPGSVQSSSGPQSVRRRSRTQSASAATSCSGQASVRSPDMELALQTRALYEQAEPKLRKYARARADVVEAVLQALSQPDEVLPAEGQADAPGLRVDSMTYMRPFGQHRVAISLLAKLIMPAAELPQLVRGCRGTLSRLQAALLMKACQHSLDFISNAVQRPDDFGGHEALLLQVEAAAIAWVQSVDYSGLLRAGKGMAVPLPDERAVVAEETLPLTEACKMASPAAMLPYSSPAAALWRSNVSELALECGPVLPVSSPVFLQGVDHKGGSVQSPSVPDELSGAASAVPVRAARPPPVHPAVTGLSSEEVAMKKESHQLLDSAFSAVSVMSPPPGTSSGAATPTRPLLMQRMLSRSEASAGTLPSPAVSSRRPWDASSIAAGATSDLQAAARGATDAAARLAQLPAALHARAAVSAEENLAVHVSRLLLLRHLLFVNCDCARAWRGSAPSSGTALPAGMPGSCSDDDDADDDAATASTCPTLLGSTVSSAAAARPRNGPLADPALAALLPRAGAVRLGQRVPAARVAWWRVASMRGHVLPPPTLASSGPLRRGDSLRSRPSAHGTRGGSSQSGAKLLAGEVGVRVDGKVVPAKPSALMIGRNHIVLADYEPKQSAEPPKRSETRSKAVPHAAAYAHIGTSPRLSPAVSPPLGDMDEAVRPVRGAAGTLEVRTILPVQHIEAHIPTADPTILVLSVLSVGEVPHLASVPHLGSSRLPESLSTAGVSLKFDSPAAAQHVRGLMLKRKNICAERKASALRRMLAHSEYKAASQRAWEWEPAAMQAPSS